MSVALQSWQTRMDVCLSGTRARQLDVRITGKHLVVGLKGSPPIVDGDLHKPIKSAEEHSYWTLEDSKEVTIFLQKVSIALPWQCKYLE